MKTTGTMMMTFEDRTPMIEWRGSIDPKTGIITLVGKSVDPYSFDRLADDGGRL